MLFQAALSMHCNDHSILQQSICLGPDYTDTLPMAVPEPSEVPKATEQVLMRAVPLELHEEQEEEEEEVDECVDPTNMSKVVMHEECDEDVGDEDETKGSGEECDEDETKNPGRGVVKMKRKDHAEECVEDESKEAMAATPGKETVHYDQDAVLPACPAGGDDDETPAMSPAEQMKLSKPKDVAEEGAEEARARAHVVAWPGAGAVPAVVVLVEAAVVRAARMVTRLTRLLEAKVMTDVMVRSHPPRRRQPMMRQFMSSRMREAGRKGAAAAPRVSITTRKPRRSSESASEPHPPPRKQSREQRSRKQRPSQQQQAKQRRKHRAKRRRNQVPKQWRNPPTKQRRRQLPKQRRNRVPKAKVTAKAAKARHDEGDVIAERKARLSRKSAAYHKAVKQGKDSGKSAEECKALGKEAALCALVHACVC